MKMKLKELYEYLSAGTPILLIDNTGSPFYGSGNGDILKYGEEEIENEGVTLGDYSLKIKLKNYKWEE